MTDVDQREAACDAHAYSKGRRAFFRRTFAAAATLAFAAVVRERALPTWMRGAGIASAFADTRHAIPGIDAFVSLSGKLTGHTSFDPLLAQRTYEALSSADSHFAQHVAELNAWLLTHGGVPSDRVTQALQSARPDLAKTVGKITRAWYLGLVGDAPQVRVISYERALMFEPVNDILTVPSYCRDVPFHWARKPLSA